MQRRERLGASSTEVMYVETSMIDRLDLGRLNLRAENLLSVYIMIPHSIF